MSQDLFVIGTTTVVYTIFRDHLGTITELRNSSNGTTSEYSFDAWGRRRNKTTWSYDLTAEPALFADRGFTGHEHMQEFNLINMNGRLYDPVVGRFLNPDNYIQDPSNTQSYNRYSYCLNNPLKYTDPNGQEWKWPKFDWFYAIPGIGQLGYIMQTINDNTVGLRQEMSDLGIPDFNFSGNINSGGAVNYNYSINGQEVYNSYSAKTESAVYNFEQNFNKLQNAVAKKNIEVSKGKNIEEGEVPWKPVGFNHGILEFETPWEWEGAITPAFFVIYPRGGSNDAYLSRHEPGHALQYLILGVWYYPLVALPSIVTSGSTKHAYMPYEKSANQLWYWWSGEYYEGNDKHYYFPKKKH